MISDKCCFHGLRPWIYGIELHNLLTLQDYLCKLALWPQWFEFNYSKPAICTAIGASIFQAEGQRHHDLSLWVAAAHHMKSVTLLQINCMWPKSLPKEASLIFLIYIFSLPQWSMVHLANACIVAYPCLLAFSHDNLHYRET